MKAEVDSLVREAAIEGFEEDRSVVYVLDDDLLCRTQWRRSSAAD